MAMLAGILVPLFRPIGLGDWRIVTSLICGIMAKESVVSSMEMLYGGGIQNVLGNASAVSILVFSLLYCPCIAAITSIKREIGTKWAIFVALWQCVIAWIAAFVMRNLYLLIFR